jgi:MAF protein
MRPLILASASPRRRALLKLGGWEFTTMAVDALEVPHANEPPVTFVRRMSETKAQLAAERNTSPHAYILACDTTVTIDDHILNKPEDAAHALAMLQQLRGRTHLVFTAITLYDTDTRTHQTEMVTSRVPMRAYSDDEINAYIATGDPFDKAGSYAIQFPSFHPVDRTAFKDCFANVMGLPLCHISKLLRGVGLPMRTDLPAECQQYIPYECPVYESILKE